VDSGIFNVFSDQGSSVVEVSTTYAHCGLLKYGLQQFEYNVRY